MLLYEATAKRAHLEASLAWYERASELAPNDVRILNRHASALTVAGESRHGSARALLERSQLLDPSFIDTRVVSANLLLAERRMAAAAAAYADLLRTEPGSLRGGARFANIVAELRAAGDFVRPLQAALEAYIHEVRGQLADAADDERRWMIEEIAGAESMLAVVQPSGRE